MPDVLEAPRTFRRAPPFNSETGRIAAKKANKVRWAHINQLKEAANDLEAIEREVSHGNSRPNPGHIALLRRAQRRWLCCAIAATALHQQERYMSLARESFDMEQRLLGRDILPTKSKSKRSKSTLSPHDLPIPDPVSCGVAPTPEPTHKASGNCCVDTSNALPASEKATVAPVDDAPF